MWRGRTTLFYINRIVAKPASYFPDCSFECILSSDSSKTSRIPFLHQQAEALSITGNRFSRSFPKHLRNFLKAPAVPEQLEHQPSIAIIRAEIFPTIPSIGSGGGPIKVMPCLVYFTNKIGVFDKNHNPG